MVKDIVVDEEDKRKKSHTTNSDKDKQRRIAEKDKAEEEEAEVDTTEEATEEVGKTARAHGGNVQRRSYVRSNPRNPRKAKNINEDGDGRCSVGIGYGC